MAVQMQHNLSGLKINKSTHQSNTDSSAALKKETRAEAHFCQRL